MAGAVNIEVKDGGRNNSIAEDEMNSEEEIWRGGRLAKAYEYARELGDLLTRAATGNIEILSCLVDYVGKHLITAQDNRGNTPLHLVAWLGGSIEAAQMLISQARGLPNVEDKHLLRMKNKRGNTALHEAVCNRHADLVRYLLSKDLEPVYWKNASEKSPLYLALETEDSAIHEALFSHSLEPSKIEGLPPIHGALVHRIGLGLHKLIPKKHMKLFAMTDSTGGNVFHLEAHLDWPWAFEFLQPETEYLTLEQDMNGDLPVHIASKMGYVKHIKRLEKVSHCLNGQGQTILHVAAKYGRASVVKYILSNPDLGMLLNVQDNDGNTALHLAAMHSQPTTLIHLVRTDGIRLDVCNNQCLLAFDVALQRRKAEGYKIRNQLACLALFCSPARKGPLESPELILVRAEARDEELSVVRSRKRMPSRDIVKDYINSRMLVATLVATVTFAAGFAVPGGFNSSDTASKDERGMATMLDNKMFQAFAICNTIAMFCSVTVVVNLIWAQIVDVDVAIAAFERTTLPLQIALPAMSTAFLTGVTLTLGKLPWLANTIFYLGLVFLLIISFAKLLAKPLLFHIRRRPLRRLTFWLIPAFIYLWRVETYIYDDNDAKDDRREKKTFASPPEDVAGESRTDDSAKAKCEDALHPPSH